MAKTQDRNRSQPLTLAALREYGELDNFSPQGSFDFRGQWKNVYRIWLVGRKSSGFLSIERKPASDGRSASLSIEMSVLQAAKVVHRTKTEVQCAIDALSTPLEWETRSETLDADLQPIRAAHAGEKAIIKDGKIIVSADGERLGTGKGSTKSWEIPASYTSNWSLFDAVQHLPGKDATPLEFVLMEDLDLKKEGQRLSYWKSTKLDIGNETIQLTGYQQIGRGVLPYQYWVDDQHRLLFVISGIRAYIFDPNAQKDFEQRLPRLLGRK